MQRDLLALFFSRFTAIHILPSAILDTVSALDRFVSMQWYHGMEMRMETSLASSSNLSIKSVCLR